MKFLTLLIAVSILTAVSIRSQPLNSFSSAVIKKEDTGNSPHLSLSGMRFSETGSKTNSFLHAARTKPGVAFLSSAIVPGSAQAANGKWVRAGMYALAEAAAVLYHFNRLNLAKRQEKNYERYANTNWSVVAYAQWLVDYSSAHNLDNGYEQLAAHLNGKTPDYTDTTKDWLKINLHQLQAVERNTPYVYESRRASNFSHNLPDYGSQQYYELISKYWQFQSGWKDVHENPRLNPNFPHYKWDGSDASPDFYEGRDRAAEFNDNYRLAGNILSLILINHLVSAFDGLMTVKVNNSRLQRQADFMMIDSFTLTFDF